MVKASTPSEMEALKAIMDRFDIGDDYVIMDLETSGLSMSDSVIVDMGHVTVKGGEVHEVKSRLLDWSKVDGLDTKKIQSDLLKQATEYARIGRPHYYGWDRLQDEGEHPFTVLHEYCTAIYNHIVRGGCILGHNFWRFDRAMINSHTRRFMSGYQLPWGNSGVFDTGLIEKAIQLNMVPFETDTIDSWCQRVSNKFAKGVKYNMEHHCVPKYDIANRYQTDQSQIHTAGFDCTLVHYLLKTYRELADIARGEKTELENSSNSGITGHNPHRSHFG